MIRIYSRGPVMRPKDRALVVLDEAGLLRSNINKLLFALWMGGAEEAYIAKVGKDLSHLPPAQRQNAHFELMRRMNDRDILDSPSISAHFAYKRGTQWLKDLEMSGVRLIKASNKQLERGHDER